MKIVLLSCAAAEFAQAVDYYNEQGPGLGYEFAAEVNAALERVAKFPEAWPMFSARLRRCLLDRFPYGVLYGVVGERVLVVAVMHLRRGPRAWAARAQAVAGESGSQTGRG